MWNGFVAEPEVLRAAGARAHQVTDELRAFDSHSITMASADVGHDGLARTIDTFTTQWQASVDGFVEEGHGKGDKLISCAAEYEAVDQANASAIGAILAILTDQNG
ncbi:hypothetical protein [Streptomyces sp. NPDC051569]|uniref:hypothetical protein n=1 Tax=Streptomyces sp. NPDC051569 TaxID=3365661 RepID=UPI0037B2F68E